MSAHNGPDRRGARGIGADVGLDLPLCGLHLIEASAGTGKTFTLTSLALRLLLERGVALPQILAVTFTRAATQELRQRLRRRIRLAQHLLEQVMDADETQGELAITRAILDQAAARAGAIQVRQRLSAALVQMDEAMVSTIHGFCHRALREFGFRAGSLASLHVADHADEVWDEVAGGVWRSAAHRDDALHPLLIALWKTPEAMARDLPRLCDPLRVTYPAAGESAQAAALHALREDAARRFEAAMAARDRCSQDQLIERVWRASADPDFAAALAARWPALLIDEFQDTDPRQWDIFRRMHQAADPATRWMCLIGDPKQAIYRFRGGDLHTYLKARETVAAQAGNGEGGIIALDANYRSTPAVLRAIETLFRASACPFVEADIQFHDVRAAGAAQDDDLRMRTPDGDDRPAPAMTLHWLPAPEGKSDMRLREDEFAAMSRAAVRAIAELLACGRLRGQALRPADIAVLTQTNDQVAQMRSALANAGIAAAALSNNSVFASETAKELQTLLAALLEPGDPGRMRAALATRVIGLDADAIAAFDAGEGVAHEQARAIEAAAEVWPARGPLPALLPFATAAAARWLAMPGGARRLTDLLHLLELLQAESAARPGPAEQWQWFARQCANARGGVEDVRQLRLESDGGAVQIATVHKSKGLEYAVVVLPFAAYHSEPSVQGMHSEDFHDAQGRPARAWRRKGALDSADWDEIEARVDREERAEAQRQLYVALTRAKHAVHIVWSRNRRTDGSALHWLLHAGERTGRKQDTLDRAGMRARIAQLAAASGGSIVIRDDILSAPAIGPSAATVDAQDKIPAARKPQRRFHPDARLHSFSSLHAQSEDALSPRGAEDEATVADDDLAVEADPAAADTAELAGTAFGNAVHDALESIDFAAWHAPADSSDRIDSCPPDQRALIERALLRQGLAATPAHLAQTARLIARALHAPLPGGVRLAVLPPARRVREMSFHFRLRPTRIDNLYRLLQTHGYPRLRKVAPAVIEGLMQGYVDLVYRDDDGRHYVLDYKTNRLPAYDAASLRRSIVAQDYDLQYLIYLVALRRWLRLRHGAGFDPARAIGGAVYLFLRGLPAPVAGMSAVGPGGADMPGLYIDAVAPRLLAELDDLFDGVAVGEAR
ncbi:MAG: hypothetical protein E6Q88_09340 [Lysobacteraceae bacterium]|nr:MAG: hypothetical protein E6Q88_09340 [Xanthomonadaceae bacterium]